MIYLVFLHSIWISQRKLSLIFANYTNYKDFFESINFSTLKKYFPDVEIENIIERKSKLDLGKIEKIIIEKRVEIVTINDSNYPSLLKEISNPPYFFYLRWKIDNSPKIAVIWSRNMTSYWEKSIENIISWIIKYFVIVSWWAVWCDSYAHKIAMKNNWTTISVIWTWIDIDYPIFNKKMYDEIIENDWWIISIFPLWEQWKKYNFPIRNEIISWLSNWVLVIEAREKSWTLITVNLALEQGKDIFAIPGDIFKSNSIWANNLIKNWNAKMVIEAEDILEEYNINISKKDETQKKVKFENALESLIYETLFQESYNIDDLMIKLNLWLTEISVTLSMLEIRGIIKKTVQWNYEIN